LSSLALGTAQFGSPYGIANRAGRIPRADAIAILERAYTSGVATLDTAIDYGQAEQELGEIGVAGWQVISKLPAVPDSCSNVSAWVRNSVQGSLARLRIPRLYGLLLHRPQQLLESHGLELYRALIELREAGMTEKIGVSIYDPDILAKLGAGFQVDIVQAPFSIVDRRLANSGWLDKLHAAGTEVHVRSIFLQGLLLMKRGDRPAKFAPWQSLWDRWDKWLECEGLSALQGCLQSVRSQPGIDRIVVGIDNIGQLEQILRCLVHPVLARPAELACEDLNLIDPSRWSSL
jgi:aryl-alcohol dehydrogenase-like predicted oxidoreductase